ncbi:hypothetical protein KY326_04210 [Candidatus Woesearchaeota archaeon]|nr:hypothetical protein [Candidatus Woesearchaeota archaeon]
MELVERTITLLDSFTDEELRTLASEINRRLERKSQETLWDLKKGDKVKVMKKGNVLWTGVVERKMIKNIVVKRDSVGTQYRVPASMLVKVD